MKKDKIIYTDEDYIIFKGEPYSWCIGSNCIGKTLKEIEEIYGKEIIEVHRYITRKKIIYKIKRK